MYIVTVIPIKKAITKETLSYMSASTFPVGSLIEIPIREKLEKGLVLSVEDAREMKATIKRLDFELKKIPNQTAERIFSEEILASISSLAEMNAVTSGSLLSELLKNTDLIDIKRTSFKGTQFEHFAISERQTRRFEIYKSIIRDVLAKKKTIFITAPTKRGLQNLFETLKKGIEDYTFLLTKETLKKELQRLEKLQSEKGRVIIGSSDMLLRLDENLHTIILEGEHSRFWRSQTKPYFDTKAFLTLFAKQAKVRIFFGDLLFSIETYEQINQGAIQEYGKILNKLEHPIKTLFVDTSPKEEVNKTPFHPFSKELQEMIRFAYKKKKSFFIFGTRRGVSSQTICLDCKESVLCKECQSPVVLHRKHNGEKYIHSFVCHHCGTRRDSLETCQKCGSWRLESFGIGIEKIADEVEKLTGEKPLIIDSDNLKSNKKTLGLIQKHIEEGGIIVGTSLAFEYLKEESVEYSAVASFDSLFSIPDFRSEEHIVRTLLHIKLLAREYMLVQARNAVEELVEEALEGNIGQFVKAELKTRKQFLYPPFQTFIKITIEEKKEKIVEEINRLKMLFEKEDKTIFPALIKNKKGNHLAHILLKVKDNISDELRSKLLSLPPFMSVKVNPESLL